MVWPCTRWTQPLLLLAVCVVLNLMTSIAIARPVAAEVPGGLLGSPALAGALGGLVGGMVHISAICLAPERPDHHDVRRAVIEALFSMIVGAIAAGYLTKQVAGVLPRIDPSDRLSVGFGVGVLAWRAAPGLIGAIRLLTSPALIKEAVLRMLNAAPRTGGMP